MKVVILCGGLGTRLREETEYRPKPMVEVGGKPILWHIMKMYAFYGYTDFILCLGYKGHVIREYFLNYDAMNIDCTICLGKKEAIRFHGQNTEQNFRVTLADTGAESMTGARLKRIERHLDDDLFMMTYGDGVSNVNVSELLAFHKRHGRTASVTTVRPPSRYGIIRLKEDGIVNSFLEKPQVEGWANAGFFVFHRNFLDYLRPDPDCVLEHEPLERLASNGELMAYKHEGFFCGMDTYRDYLYLNELWKNGHAPWAIWES